MAAAQIYAIKLMLKTIGLDAEALEVRANELQKVFLEFKPDELREALKTMLDYRKNQEQNELRMLAIMARLEINDPCETATRDIQNGHDYV